MGRETFTTAPVVVAEDLGHVKVGIRVVEEDVEGYLGPLLLDVLDEDGDLHGAADLPPDGEHPDIVLLYLI